MQTRALYDAVVLMVTLLTMPAAIADEKETLIVGNWLTEEKDGIIRIYKAESGQYDGQIIGGDDTKRVDVNNPDPALRSKLLMGQYILRGFKYDGDGKWSGGTIYDPDSGKSYKCNIELTEASTLYVRCYVGTPIFGRTGTWTRYDEGAAAKQSQ